jgi:hypothetical protein
MDGVQCFQMQGYGAAYFASGKKGGPIVEIYKSLTDI